MRVIAACTFAFSLITASAIAQELLPITGTISDATGAAIVSATVDAVVAGRVVGHTTTGPDGRYRLNVPARVPYEIRAQRDGFADATIRAPGASGATSHSLTLQIGGVSDTLVVTASRGAESRAGVTAAATVITAEDLRDLGSTSLVDALRFVPGLAAEGAGREGAMTSVFSRGGESDYNLVLIDGVRVNQSGGAFDFSRISSAEVQRVEVIRGAQSSLWGSDAMGAVIQVFTRRDDTRRPARVAGSIEGGSFGTFRGDAGVSGAGSGGDYSLSVVRRSTAGAFENRLRERERFEQTAFDAAGGLALGARATLRGSLRVTEAEAASVGNLTFGVSDTGAIYTSRDVSWHLSVAHTAGARYTGTASMSEYRLDMLNADRVGDPSINVFALLEGRPGARFPDSPRLVRLLTASEFAAAQAGPFGPNQFLATTPFGISDFTSMTPTEFHRKAVRYQGDVAWQDAHRTSAGWEFERETNPLLPLDLDTHALFVQHRVALGDRWSLTAGGRVDNKSSFDVFFSPKISVGGYLVPARSGGLSSAKVFFNAGKGIKSPTFAERFGGSFADGNADLKVERARSTDAGVELTFADQRLRGAATWFHSQFRDQVEFRSTSPSFSLDGLPDFINVAGSRATGVELEAALQRPIAGVTAAAAYTLTDTEVEETVQTGVQSQPGQPLLRRPKHSGTVRVAYDRGRVSINANVRIVGQRHDSSFLFLQSVPNAAFPAAVTTDITVNPGYAVVGVGLEVAAHEQLRLFVRGDNVGDTSYDSALGYPGLPRAFVVGARFELGR
jgi:outer membrane cobalamin receptor